MASVAPLTHLVETSEWCPVKGETVWVKPYVPTSDSAYKGVVMDVKTIVNDHKQPTRYVFVALANQTSTGQSFGWWELPTHVHPIGFDSSLAVEHNPLLELRIIVAKLQRQVQQQAAEINALKHLSA